MDKGHKYASIIVWALITTIDLVIGARRRFIPVNLVFAFLLYKGPDMDKSHDLRHRHWFFHSCIIPVLILIFLPETYFLSIVWGTHLLCDLYQKKGKKPVLGYLIHFRNDALGATGTRLYLIGNALICFIGSVIAGIPL